MASIAFLREIIASEVEASPNELGPHIISDRAWVGADKREQALGCNHASHRIESARNQFPLLEITKEHAKNGNPPGARVGCEDLPAALHMNRLDAAPIASMPLTDDGYGFRRPRPGPTRRRCDLLLQL